MTTPWETLAAAITRLSEKVDLVPKIREATVTTLAPLSVRFDTDIVDTLVTGSLAKPVPGDRVLVVTIRHFVWILGVRGGGTLAAYLQSTTALANGTVTLSWTDAYPQASYDPAQMWKSATPQRLTAPVTGIYRVTVNVRSNGVAPITAITQRNGVALDAFTHASGFGVGGAASHATRTFLVVLSAGDYLTVTATSTGAASGSHSILAELVKGVY